MDKITQQELRAFFGEHLPVAALTILESPSLSLEQKREHLKVMAESKHTKQVIVMRNDLNMRKGKMAAQAGHAVLGALMNYPLHMLYDEENTGPGRDRLPLLLDWMNDGMRKICVRTDSLQELLEIADHAKQANIVCHVVTDAGHTEFPEPTVTCLALGPDRSIEIDKITGKLKLL